MKRIPPEFKHVVAVAAFAVVSGFAVALVVVAWPVFVLLLWPNVGGAMTSPVWRGGATLALLHLGVLLFFVREDFRRLYGLAECLFGVAAIWIGLGSKVTEPTLIMVTIAGGIYVVVRGCDNLARGQEAVEKDREHRPSASAGRS